MSLLQANHPRQDYAIAKKALVKNTLVSLPTGQGKTFIAAVVMYNFYRWFPSGKVIFVAPTRPLVMQQAQACYDIVGIPQGDSLNNPPNEQTNPSKAISDSFTCSSLFLSRGHSNNDGPGVTCL